MLEVRKLAEHFLHQYDPDPEHPLHVAKLSLQLFEQLTLYKQINPNHADILYTAALLHDVGHALSSDGRNHHIASEKFILSQRWPGWDKITTTLCATVARLHRKSTRHIFAARADTSKTFKKSENIQTVLALAAVLRIADALDRSHSKTIQSVRIIPENSCWRLITSPHPPGPEEVLGLKKKSNLWNQIYGKLFWLDLLCSETAQANPTI